MRALSVAEVSNEGQSARGSEAVRAFDELARAITDGVDTDELLRLMTAKVCALLNVRRSSIYLREPGADVFRGRMSLNGGHAVKRYVAGVESDGFTQEILATKAPVFISDARHDPRPVRSFVRRWGVRSTLGVPMILGGEVIGLLFLDDGDQPHHFDAGQQETAATFANLAAAAVTLSEHSHQLRQKVNAVAQDNEMLQRVSTAEERLMRLAAEGASPITVARAVAELTGKPCSIHDPTYRRVALGSPAANPALTPRLFDQRVRSHPDVAQCIRDLPPDRTSIVNPLPEAGLQHRYLVTPLMAQETRLGYIVVMESGRRLTAFDAIIARRSAALVALTSAREWTATDQSVAREWGSHEDRFATAAIAPPPHLSPYVMAVLAAQPGQHSLSKAELEEAIATAAFGDVALCDTGDDEVAAVAVKVDPELSRPAAIGASHKRVDQLVASFTPPGRIVAGLSDVCERPEDLGRSLTVAYQMMRCAASYAGNGATPFVLSAADLGACRLFLAGADREEALRFAEDCLGPLLRPRAAELLNTLITFFDCSRNVRHAASALQVHENTIRYRLSRVAGMTGLEVAGIADDQLVAQVALCVLRLDGRVPAGAGMDHPRQANFRRGRRA